MRVVRGYTAQYPDPIVVRRADRVRVGADDPEFPGWWWCTGPDGRSGWVPEALLQREAGEAILLQDYTARELSVSPGAEVILHHALSGWAWVTTPDGRAGWIPQTSIAAE